MRGDDPRRRAQANTVAMVMRSERLARRLNTSRGRILAVIDAIARRWSNDG